MALSKNVVTSTGINVKDAYIRVSNVRLHGKEALLFDVCVHANSDDLAVEKRRGSSAYVLDGDNPLAQAYAHLKQTDDYSDARDI
tara:strand:- start:273 stop:527 length:255 start_codon:yes stop_codon:yes gene_type:complete